jgi:hypothetical protein
MIEYSNYSGFDAFMAIFGLKRVDFKPCSVDNEESSITTETGTAENVKKITRNQMPQYPRRKGKGDSVRPVLGGDFGS